MHIYTSPEQIQSFYTTFEDFLLLFKMMFIYKPLKKVLCSCSKAFQKNKQNLLEDLKHLFNLLRTTAYRYNIM